MVLKKSQDVQGSRKSNLALPSRISCSLTFHLCIILLLHGHFYIVIHSIFDFSQSALGHEYVAEVEKHSSQTDAARGFGGKYGVEKDRADKVSDNTLPMPPN